MTAGEFLGNQNQNIPNVMSNMIYTTTNENIIQFQNNQRKAMASKYGTGSPNIHTSETKTLNNSKINRFMNMQDLIEEENDEIRTDQSEYDKSVSIRKGRFNVIPHEKISKINEEFKNYNIESNSGNVGYLRPIPQVDSRVPSDYNFNYNYNIMPMQTRQSMTEYSLKERSETGTARNLSPFINEFNQPMLRDDNGYYRSKNELMKTPMFTNTNIDPQIFYQNRLPPLIFESRSNREIDNERLEADEKSSVYTNIEDKGSPWNSSYFDKSNYKGSVRPVQSFQNKSEWRSQTNKDIGYENQNIENPNLMEQNMQRDIGLREHQNYQPLSKTTEIFVFPTLIYFIYIAQYDMYNTQTMMMNCINNGFAMMSQSMKIM